MTLENVLLLHAYKYLPLRPSTHVVDKVENGSPGIAMIRVASGAYFDLHPQCDFQSYIHGHKYGHYMLIDARYTSHGKQGRVFMVRENIKIFMFV